MTKYEIKVRSLSEDAWVIDDEKNIELTLDADFDKVVGEIEHLLGNITNVERCCTGN